MKHHHDLAPEIRPHTNGFLSGRLATELELAAVADGRVNDLPITRTVTTVVTVWRCRSLLWRLRFLFTGRLTVTVLGRNTLPLAVAIGDTMQQ